MKKIKIINFILMVIFLFLFLLVIRNITPSQLDDVSSVIPCEREDLESSETLMIIPLFENHSISENISWCRYILSFNKTLGMHGVFHSYEEFNTNRDKEYILFGMEEFNKCFGFYPKIFEAPQLALNKENKKLLEEMGFKVRGWPEIFFRKVYHCQDLGKFAVGFGKIKINNEFIEKI